MMIEIKGVQFVNKGAELMLHACIEQIKAQWPDAEIVLTPDANSPYLKRAQLGAWQKLNLHKHVFDLNGLSYFLPHAFRRALRRFGIVTEADVDLVLDASGFAYGDSWPVRQLTHTSKQVQRMALKGKPYIFLAQAFGPFTHPKLKHSIRSYWGSAALIVARDTSSFDALSAILSHDAPLMRFPDFTNLLSPIIDEKLSPGVLVIPNSKMISSKNQRKDWHESYVNLLEEMCKAALASGKAITLLNHDGGEDLALCNTLNERLGGAATILSLECPLAVKALISKADGVVSSRYHGCVSALSQGVPTVGTSWSHKYEALFADYGCSDMLFSSPSMMSTNAVMARLLSDEYRDRCRTNPAIEEQKSLAREMWSSVFTVIASSVLTPGHRN
ncbi:polysaccharide pyruvyl transferase family protein [Shewanella sp. FJAT-52076]|uniref:polysaccharide pyruvyl transferase family protein n=1 Tax=Shewanella sp. FJAT-52076 TaxID=2864202 RepID=UPI001C65DFF4|nr:polysaccharide pyruvyl transferase family protein [Shewanella sp. FJAT-52076]QYJ74045.1 polysaccharide pyruvyl transferase family protein [Shewanella sp. FJAT-52076]